MGHALEWSRAVVGRLGEDRITALKARHGVLSERLSRELAAGELPFLSMPYRARLEEGLADLLPRLARFRHMVVLGIGGSALGARALQRAFAPGQDRPGHAGPWLWIADNVCAETMEAWLSALPPEDTVVVCISKSGGTIETLSQYFLFRQWLQNALGDAWNEHMVVVTDAVKGYLRQEAGKRGLRLWKCRTIWAAGTRPFPPWGCCPRPLWA